MSQERALREAKQALSDAEYLEVTTVPMSVFKDILGVAEEAMRLLNDYDRQKLLDWKRRRKEFLSR